MNSRYIAVLQYPSTGFHQACYRLYLSKYRIRNLEIRDCSEEIFSIDSCHYEFFYLLVVLSFLRVPRRLPRRLPRRFPPAAPEVYVSFPLSQEWCSPSTFCSPRSFSQVQFLCDLAQFLSLPQLLHDL